MTDLGLSLLALFAGAVLLLPRQWAVLGLLGTLCYLTQGQSITVAGMTFTAMRIILLISLVRILLRGELGSVELNTIDKSLLTFMFVSTLFYIASRATATALIFQFGACYNACLSYFVFRSLIRNCQDIETLVPPLAILITPLAGLMIFETLTGRNVFTVFGGLPESPVFRDGYFRAQGPFRSAITAGTFGATLMPLFAIHALYFRPRLLALLGLAATTGITAASISNGPLIAYCSGLFALALWTWRRYLRTLQWSFLLILILLHICMKAPVWFLIAKLGNLTGGSGWHRAFIIDQALTHWDTWWLSGTDNTGDWMPYQLIIDGSADITNQYLVAGLRSGLIAMLLFAWLFVCCFKHIGSAIHLAELSSLTDARILWGIGCTLFITAVNFISVAYFDQIEVIFYLQLAVVASITYSILERRTPCILNP